MGQLAPGRLDPVALYPRMEPTFTDWTWDSLVTVAKTGGSDGVLLVPDLALAMPAVSGNGRPHVHSAAAAALLERAAGAAAGLPYALERVFQLNSSAASEVREIMARRRAGPPSRAISPAASRSTIPPARSRFT